VDNELLQFFSALVSVSAFSVALVAMYKMRKKLERKEVAWREYRKSLTKCKRLFPIGVILALIGYYGLEINLRLIIPFTGLEIQPVLVWLLLILSLFIGVMITSLTLTVLIYSLKKPSTDRQE
jgi:hypothetical protein